MARTIAEVEADLVYFYELRRKPQSYEVGDSGSTRRATNATLSEINTTIIRLEAEKNRITRGGIRVRGVAPIG